MTPELEQAIQDLLTEKQIPDNLRLVVMGIARDIVLPAIDQGKIPGYQKVITIAGSAETCIVVNNKK